MMADSFPGENRTAEEFAADELVRMAAAGAPEICSPDLGRCPMTPEHEAEFIQDEITVAEAMVKLWGTEAPGKCRECAAECDAEGKHVTRDSFLRFAGYAEELLQAGHIAQVPAQ